MWIAQQSVKPEQSQTSSRWPKPVRVIFLCLCRMLNLMILACVSLLDAGDDKLKARCTYDCDVS